MTYYYCDIKDIVYYSKNKKGRELHASDCYKALNQYKDNVYSNHCAFLQ